jgi:uncharacterized protein YecT (DUF1311 family)
MAMRDRATEIIQIKSRAQRRASHIDSQLSTLKRQWEACVNSPVSSPDFFPIRTVTLLEVFSRAWIAQLIDHGSPYLENAVALAKTLKLDYDLVRVVHGRAITLGDIVAYSVPVNTFSQVIGHFETLIGQAFIAAISKAVDRWAVELEGKPATPIIEDSGRMCSRLSRLFEVRHILCHELPGKQVYDVAEIPSFLTSAEQFAKGTTTAFNQLLYGNYPLTNADIKAAARDALRKSDQELERVTSELKAKGDEVNRKLLEEAQEVWVRFREAQSAFRSDLARGGSIAGLLWSNEATAITDARIKELRWYLDREEYDL